MATDRQLVLVFNLIQGMPEREVKGLIEECKEFIREEANK